MSFSKLQHQRMIAKINSDRHKRNFRRFFYDLMDDFRMFVWLSGAFVVAVAIWIAYATFPRHG